VDRDAVGIVVGVGLCIGALDLGADRQREGAVLGVSLGRCMVANEKFDGWLCGSVCGIVAKRLSGSGCRYGGWGGAWYLHVKFWW